MASHYLKGLIKKRENDFLHRQRVTGQAGIVLNFLKDERFRCWVETLACEGGEALDKVTQRSPSLEVFKAMFDGA